MQFEEIKVSASYQDCRRNLVEEEYTTHIRDIMACIREVIRDESLQENFLLYPTRKYMYQDGSEVRFWDDLDCGKDWWDIQVRFDDAAEEQQKNRLLTVICRPL